VPSSVAIPAASRPGASAPRSLHDSLIELLPDAVLALDIQGGRIVLANAAAERLLDTTRDHLFRLGLRDLVRPWDVAQVERVEAALVAEGQWRGALWLLRQDGTFVPTEVAAQALSVDGRLLAQFCCRDVSAHWRDDALRRVVSHAAERLAGSLDEREVLRTVVSVALPGLADAALVELDAVDDAEPVAVTAVADPSAPDWPGVTVDESPAEATCTMIRRGASLAVPLVVQGRRIGTLTLRRTRDRRWDAREQPLVEELATHAAHAIDQARQWGSAHRELSDRASMLRILSLIDTDVTPRRVFDVLLEEAQATLEAEDGGAARWDHQRGFLLPAQPKPGRRSHCAIDRRLMVSVVANERCSLLENEYQQSMGRETPAGRAGARAVLAVPLMHQDQIWGSASISQISSTRRFQPSDARRFERLAAAAAKTLAGIERHRIAGAQLVAHEAAHLLNNDLTLAVGSIDLVRESPDLSGTLAPLVDTALGGLSRATGHLAQLQRLRRVETSNGPLGPRLDLPRSTG
jgi:PAS domain S-box-containing protein